MAKAVGIALGTTSSVIAAWEGGQPWAVFASGLATTWGRTCPRRPRSLLAEAAGQLRREPRLGPGRGPVVVRVGVRGLAPHTVFRTAVPVAAVAFVLAFLLPEVPLRTVTQTADPRRGTGHAARVRRRGGAAGRAVAAPEPRRPSRGVRTAGPPGRAGPFAGGVPDDEQPRPRPAGARNGRGSGPPVDRVRVVAPGLASRGYVQVAGDMGTATGSGQQAAAPLQAAQRDALDEILDGWAPQENQGVQDLVPGDFGTTPRRGTRLGRTATIAGRRG